MQNGGFEAVQRTLDVIAEFLKSGMDTGEFVQQNPRQLALSITGLHLFYFAADDISSRFIGSDIFAPRNWKLRRRAVLEHSSVVPSWT